MKLAFTICSANYLHQALTLKQSLLKHNPDYKFIIGLVDEYTDENPQTNDLFLKVKDLNIKDFDDMCWRYNIVELNTAVKPFYIEHLFNTYNPEFVCYFDPDILIFQPLNQIENAFNDGYDVVLTPHRVSSNNANEMVSSDLVYIQTGVFNLGFGAYKNSPKGVEIVRWWQQKLQKDCLVDIPRGLFVDQIWMNLCVVFVEKTYILFDKGHNMAPWNLHERTLTQKNNSYWVNDETPLTFYHFSSFRLQKGNYISRDTQYNLDNRPDLKPLFEHYAALVQENGYHKYSKIKYAYQSKDASTMQFIKRKYKALLFRVGYWALNRARSI